MIANNWTTSYNMDTLPRLVASAARDDANGQYKRKLDYNLLVIKSSRYAIAICATQDASCFPAGFSGGMSSQRPLLWIRLQRTNASYLALSLESVLDLNKDVPDTCKPVLFNSVANRLLVQSTILETPVDLRKLLQGNFKGLWPLTF
jgi:hypothetical protein